MMTTKKYNNKNIFIIGQSKQIFNQRHLQLSAGPTRLEVVLANSTNLVLLSHGFPLQNYFRTICDHGKQHTYNSEFSERYTVPHSQVSDCLLGECNQDANHCGEGLTRRQLESRGFESRCWQIIFLLNYLSKCINCFALL